MPEFSAETTVLVALLSASAAKFLFAFLTRSDARRGGRERAWERVGTVTQLNVYPIKSCRGVPAQTGLATPLGLKVGNALDRHWVVVRSNGDFITQRQFSKMALIQTEVRGDDMVLTAPAMPPMTVPLSLPVTADNVVNCRVWGNHLKGVDCGEAVGQWLSSFIQEPGLRLLWAAPSLPRVQVSLKNKSPAGNPALPGDQTAFADYCSFMLLGESSLEELNTRLKQPVTMKSFRPNVVISGCPAFDEDSWEEVRIGDGAKLRILDPCDRCLLTTVNPEIGQRNPDSEPLNTLKSFRCFPKYGASPLFGMNATVDVEAVIKVGDAVFAVRK